jgi:hypothetical protein
MAGYREWSTGTGARCFGSMSTHAAMASRLTTVDVDGSVSRALVGSARWRQRLFFTGFPIATAVAVFVGFAPTYYLKTAYGTPALAPLYHFHGFLFSLWMVLLVG